MIFRGMLALIAIAIAVFVLSWVWIYYNVKKETVESFSAGQDSSKCIYDPKVEELKKLVDDWLNARVEPWSGAIEFLNGPRMDKISQLQMCKGKSSYTIDKEIIYLCVKDAEGAYYDDNTLIHVILHEFAHAMCREVGHTKRFDEIFVALMDEAHASTCPNQHPIYNKNLSIRENYCGTSDKNAYNIR